jgi:glycosyltransferase involved in cell wall biosynthesis
MMKKAIIIPIFLKLNQREELPTLEELRLAKRAIESLNRLKDQDFILVLPVCFDLVDSAEEVTYLEMDRFLRQTVKDLRQERTLVFSSRHLKCLREYLDQKSFRNYFSLIDLKGFSKIRNIGLLLAQALSMDVAVFIDDDEVVEDPDYLEVACEHLIRRWNGKEVVGKGGFYVNPDGTILLPPSRLWWRFLWDKAKWMNRVWEKILLSKERLVPSPMLLGGNLVLHRSLFRSIPFDPYIARGEDTDYLINASQWGFCLLFDKQLQIKHLHPKRTGAYFDEELRLDIERYLYERQKMKAGLSIDLNPYPGYFLSWTLYPKAALTSLLLSLDYLGKGEWKKAVACIDNIRLVLKKKEGGWLNYLRFRADWERVMVEIRNEGLSHLLKACWV